MFPPPCRTDAIRWQGTPARHQNRQDAAMEGRHDSGLDRKGWQAMIQALTCLETALELLHRLGQWPVAIKPEGKAPIGESWGSTRPTEQSIKATFNRCPKAGVGLLLGPQ